MIRDHDSGAGGEQLAALAGWSLAMNGGDAGGIHGDVHLQCERCSGGMKNTTSDATDEIPQLAYLTKSTLKLVIGLRSKQVGLQKCESVAWGGGCCELLLKYHYCDTTHDLQILPCPKLHITRAYPHAHRHTAHLMRADPI